MDNGENLRRKWKNECVAKKICVNFEHEPLSPLIRKTGHENKY
jgi:hypothetical protein